MTSFASASLLRPEHCVYLPGLDKDDFVQRHQLNRDSFSIIARFISSEDLGRLGRVCKSVRELSKTPFLWLTHLKRDYPNVFTKLIQEGKDQDWRSHYVAQRSFLCHIRRDNPLNSVVMLNEEAFNDSRLFSRTTSKLPRKTEPCPGSNNLPYSVFHSPAQIAVLRPNEKPVKLLRSRCKSSIRVLNNFPKSMVALQGATSTSNTIMEVWDLSTKNRIAERTIGRSLYGHANYTVEKDCLTYLEGRNSSTRLEFCPLKMGLPPILPRLIKNIDAGSEVLKVVFLPTFYLYFTLDGKVIVDSRTNQTTCEVPSITSITGRPVIDVSLYCAEAGKFIIISEHYDDHITILDSEDTTTMSPRRITKDTDLNPICYQDALYLKRNDQLIRRSLSSIEQGDFHFDSETVLYDFTRDPSTCHGMWIEEDRLILECNNRFGNSTLSIFSLPDMRYLNSLPLVASEISRTCRVEFKKEMMSIFNQVNKQRSHLVMINLRTGRLLSVIIFEGAEFTHEGWGENDDTLIFSDLQEEKLLKKTIGYTHHFAEFKLIRN